MANLSRRQQLNHSTARTLAALLGTIPVALGVGVVLVRVLPLEPAWRVLLGSYSVFPVWGALAVTTFLARSARRAWLALLAALALLVAVSALGARPEGRAVEPESPLGAGR